MRAGRLAILGAAALALGAAAGAPRAAAQMVTARTSDGAAHMRVLIQGEPSPFLMLLHAAKLSPDQERDVREIMAQQSQQTLPLARQLHQAQEQISEKLLSPDPVAAADLAPIERQITQIHDQMGRAMIDTALAIRKVLKPDQLQRLAQVHDQLDSLRRQIEALIGPGPAGAMMLGPMPPLPPN
jgi:hypothetical protein